MTKQERDTAPPSTGSKVLNERTARTRGLKAFRIAKPIADKLDRYKAALEVAESTLWDRLFQMFSDHIKKEAFEAQMQGREPDFGFPPLEPDDGEKVNRSYRLDSDVNESLGELSEMTELSQGRVMELVFRMFENRLEADVKSARILGDEIRKGMAHQLIHASSRDEEKWLSHSRTVGHKKGIRDKVLSRREEARSKAEEAKAKVSEMKEKLKKARDRAKK